MVEVLVVKMIQNTLIVKAVEVVVEVQVSRSRNSSTSTT